MGLHAGVLGNSLVSRRACGSPDADHQRPVFTGGREPAAAPLEKRAKRLWKNVPGTSGKRAEHPSKQDCGKREVRLLGDWLGRSVFASRKPRTINNPICLGMSTPVRFSMPRTTFGRWVVGRQLTASCVAKQAGATFASPLENRR
jgi:hypothetical protein